MLDFLTDLSTRSRIVLFVVIAVLAHVVVRVVRAGGDWWMSGGREGEAFQRHPKVASLATIFLSTITFTIYFLAIGLILREMGIPLAAYLTSASVIGLAVGFGSQGLVQDVVMGFTLIFSDVLNVGDVVDAGGQTGRVESIGLRFTVLVTLLEQRVYVPNRNILQIARYRKGHVRGYMDVQVPEGAESAKVVETVSRIAEGMHAQHRGVILTPPHVSEIRSVGDEGWRYIRVKFRIWPGQGSLIDTPLRQRVLAAMRRLDEGYADWMVTVTYRAD